MKKLIIIGLIGLVMLGVCSCMKNKNSNSRSDRMVAYMNEKYDDNFTFVSVYGGHIGSTSHKIIVSSEKFPGEEIVVFCDASGEKEIYADNYLGIKYEEQTRELLWKAMKDCFGDNIYVYYSPANHTMTSGASNDTTFEEYISSPSSGLIFTAIVSCNEDSLSENEIIEKVHSCLKDRGICSTGDIYFDTKGANISILNNDTYYDDYLFHKKYSANLFFTMDGNMNFSNCEWSENNG